MEIRFYMPEDVLAAYVATYPLGTTLTEALKQHILRTVSNFATSKLKNARHRKFKRRKK